MDGALEFSNAAAALNCTAIGARGHIPVRTEVKGLIAKAAAGKVSADARSAEMADRRAGRTLRDSVAGIAVATHNASGNAVLIAINVLCFPVRDLSTALPAGSVSGALRAGARPFPCPRL